MPTFGRSPADVVTNAAGDVQGTTLTLYASEADATAQTSPLSTVTVTAGRWSYTHTYLTVVWARATDGTIWPVAAVPGRTTVYNAFDYGAKGDGTADDTAAIQAALNDAVAAGGTLLINGRCRTTAAIVLPTTGPVTIRASVTDANAFGALTASKASIESSGAAVFTAAAGVAVTLDLAGVNFRNTNGGISTTLFDTVQLSQSRVEACTAANYNYIFKAGDLGGVTRIVGNRFLTVKTVFCSATLTDAVVAENYIDGSRDTNATAFTGGWANSVLTGNYIDFFKRVLNLPAGAMTDVRVIGNIFDYCWCTIGTSAAAFLSSLTVVGNTWHHCTAAEANPLFTAEDADMTGTPYRAIDVSAGINRSTITGNHFLDVTEAIRLRGGVNNIVEDGNVYDDTTVTNRVDFAGDWPNSGVQLGTLDKGRYVPAFAPAMTVNLGYAALIEITLTANMTSLAVINGVHDQLYEFQFVQDGTGGRTLSGASPKLKWSGGATPTLTATAGKRDIFRLRYNAPNDAYYEVGRGTNL